MIETAVTRLATRLRSLRRERGLTLDELAERSEVSRSTLSKIERSEINPSLVVITKIADAFEITVSQLIGVEERRPAVKVPKERRMRFVDEAAGFERQVFPAFEDGPVEFVRHVIRRGGSSGDLPGHGDHVPKFVLMERGRLRVTVGDEAHDLEEGDLFSFDGGEAHRFDNAGRSTCSYFLIKRAP